MALAAPGVSWSPGKAMQRVANTVAGNEEVRSLKVLSI